MIKKKKAIITQLPLFLIINAISLTKKERKKKKKKKKAGELSENDLA
jgi:hypothetical protein